MIMLRLKSTNPRIVEHYKLVLMGQKKKKDTKLDGWGRQGEMGKGGEYEQNTLYGILKKLIKVFKNIE